VPFIKLFNPDDKNLLAPYPITKMILGVLIETSPTDIGINFSTKRAISKKKQFNSISQNAGKLE